ncbi:nucleotidyltransferase domain-containing protein [Persicitalea sp.]|uniref:nucleotidyltransferase domain-containing protein n=1 Tax=Persicitalea sp. TaxID=3100273 RepID=UPI0035944992
MLTREDVIQNVRAFTNEILASGVVLDKVMLFGSCAEEKQTPDSDIDVVLVSDQFSGFGYEDRKSFSKINIRKEYVNIETKTYPSRYFEMGDPFIDEISKSAIVVYSSGM